MTSSINELANPIPSFNMYPNPAKLSTRIDILIDHEAEVSLKILDMSGKQIAERDYGTVLSTSTVDINTSLFNAGVYLVQLSVDGYTMTKRLVVE